MSVVDEINRIQDAKSSFVEGLTNLGVEVPEGELINNVVKTVNEDIFPLIDMRYNFSMTIDSIDADIGDPLVCIIWTPVEFTGELTVDIDGWYHGTVVPNHGKVHVRVPTVNTDTGECLSAGLHTVVAQFNGDTQYKPGIVTAIVRINKVDCNIEITDTSIDDGMLIANVTTERDAGAYSPCLIDAFECGWNTEGVLLVCEGSVLTYGNPTDGRAQFYAH